MLQYSWPEISQTTDKPSQIFIAARERKARSDASGAEHPSILVVDDEVILADSVAEILNISGFCAFSAYDASTAFEITRELRPDYLLSDVMMPGMNGVDLAIHVRKMFPDMAILLFSGQAGVTDLLEVAREQGYAFELVEKPMHPVRLIERLKRMRPVS
jgi:CheY-like chemotaxis protein